jgi:GNAT superfamily N-acetyltransferase
MPDVGPDGTAAEPAALIADGLAAGQVLDAMNLVFEYIAATLAEAGRREPASIGELPVVLRRECEDLTACYAPPGALFVAYRDGRPAGCAGLTAGPTPGAAEVKRLYVRPGYRTAGIGHLLMSHVHDQAARRGFGRLVLDVLPARTAAIGFYRRLGYAECEPFATESPSPMIYMQRLIP